MADTKSSGSSKALKRYGPIAVVVVLVAGAIALAGGGDGDDGGGGNGGGNGPASESNLPLIYQEAQEQGVEGDIDWGDGCDTDRGRVAMPVRSPAPCVEPWDGEDNGGATSPGVTEDAIKIIVYQGEPDPVSYTHLTLPTTERV